MKGSLYPQRAGNGRDGAGDQHDGDHDQDRRAKQDWEGGGTNNMNKQVFFCRKNCLAYVKLLLTKYLHIYDLH